ncbi:L,D-transpeptidase family protein [Altererythrobacter salegens]|uniref:L,D-transpeptidase family protein n=1 Tax=Croceibacterium salegens TaxID=1737568 RepID=A0A6I4T1J8_9SPHN|nr:L,D-transpeptidase family protein [Croceibacterium salegens]MXO61196.1 L,D-transpeptidase family protein [Croceibacterium salegens]
MMRFPVIAALLAAALVVPLPQAAAQASWRGEPGKHVRAELREEIGERAGKTVRGFYTARDNAPMWLNKYARPSGAATLLLYRMQTAQFDGVDPDKLGIDKLVDLAERAQRGEIKDVARFEVALSDTFAEYVRAMRDGPRLPMIYGSPALEPVIPAPRSVLETAAQAPSLESYVDGMEWMHPLYAPLRKAMQDPAYSETQRRQIWMNMARLRAIPAMPMGRYVLVDTASAHLWMYEGGEPVDDMRVVVGNDAGQTPIMAGFLSQAVENPYWLVPDDIVQNEFADYILEYGPGWVADRRYEVLDSWEPDAEVLDPKTVDWQGVRDGTVSVHMRQLPGGSNFMGRVKFEFPNPQGIYLHDTPAKDLLKKTDRQLSHGCVRLEDAATMYRWLMGTPIPAAAKNAPPEQVVPLPEPVPIYITYLTVQPKGDNLVFLDDPYARDARVRIAAAD